MKDETIKNERIASARGYVPIRVKVTLSFGALVIFLGILLFVYLQYFVRASFGEQMMSSLHVMEEKNIGAYAAFMNGLKIHTIDWSSDNQIKVFAQTIVDPAVSPARRKTASDEFGAYMRDKKMRHDPEVIITDLLDQNGIVVASSRSERIGTDERQEEIEKQAHYFSKAITANFGETFSRSVIFEEDETPEPMFHIVVRMFRVELDADGNPIPLHAVLLMHFTSLPQLAGFLEHGRDVSPARDGEGSYAAIREFETLDTYVVNRDRFIVTSTRVVVSTAEKRSITTKPIEECFVNGKEIAEEYLDYRGVPVIGVSSCLAQDGLVIVNEMEASEAYATIDGLVRRTLVTGGLILTALMLFIFLVTRRFLRDLELITATARWFSLGVLSERVTVTSKDEIGQLAVAFNTMLDKVVASKKELTENLENVAEQNKFLEKTKIATMNVLEDAIEVKNRFESQKNELHSILASIDEGVLLIDKNYAIILANEMAEKLLGLPASEMMGKKAYDLVGILKDGITLPIEERPVSRVFKTGAPVAGGIEDKYAFRLLSGKEFSVAFSVAPLGESVESGVVAAFRDVTGEKALADARSAFISIASHQLRTPLTSIRWYSEMLISEDAGPLNPSQKDFMKEINDGTQRLYQTIDLLLEISRIESGHQKGDVAEVDLNQFTQDVVKELDPQVKQKNLTLALNYDPGMLPKVSLDSMLLRQVVLNLLSNAIRYTNDGGHIAIEIVSGKRNVHYSVKDDGIGIPEAEKSKLFQKFFRAENARVKVPDGSGLGLALVKDIVESWNGAISFESEEGKGAKFHFTIPLGGGNFPGNFFG